MFKESSMFEININGQTTRVDADPSTPLLWVLRDSLKLTATKYGCGVGACGACTVHVNGQAVRSCATPISAVGNGRVLTVEGLAGDRAGRAIQAAWVKHDVAQCGYCQSGQMMQAAQLIQRRRNPSDQDIDTAMNDNICRCGTYTRVKAAIKDAAKSLA
jgi:isoquinoline 1-oxidoreductase subunit alpha